MKYQQDKTYWQQRYQANPKRYYVNMLLRRQKEWACSNCHRLRTWKRVKNVGA